MIFFLKYWHLIAIASLVGLLGVQKIYTDNKYHTLEKEINGIKTKALQDTIDLQSATIDYQTCCATADRPIGGPPWNYRLSG